MKALGSDLDGLVLSLSRLQTNAIQTEHDGKQIFDGDCLPYLIKKSTGIDTLFKSKGYDKKLRKPYILYMDQEGYLAVKVFDDKSLITPTGLFFLKADWQQQLTKILDLIEDNKWIYHATRTDLALTAIIPQQKNKIKSMEKEIDFQNLEIQRREKNKIQNYISASHSNFEVVIYDKSRQIEEVKKDSLYQKLFKEKFGQESENIFRLELRIKNKKPNLTITKLLMERRFDQIPQEVIRLSNTSERVKITKKIRNMFKNKEI